MSTETSIQRPGDDRFAATVLERGLYSNRRNMERFLDMIFGRLDLTGARVVDIGGGMGLLSFAAVQRGAARAVLVEPEGGGDAAGGTRGVTRRFGEVRATLGWEHCIELEPVTFQEYDPRDESFDLALSHNSINHWDERACTALHTDPRAQETYASLFRKLHGLLKPGGRIVICDCARRNLFGDLRLTHPIAPAIEWHKHQQPQLWARLLQRVGFTEPDIRWTTLHSLGAVGRRLLANPAAAYVLTSHFRLEMVRP